MKKTIAIISISLLSACTSTATVEKNVTSRATYDLSCPAEKIQVTKLRDGGFLGTSLDLYGAKGCDRQRNYEILLYTGEVQAEGGAPSTPGYNMTPPPPPPPRIIPIH